ncbi:MAG: HAMP domain-containing histidine kinase [Magnetococcales bacterium]|nr:HAMP domain-containing histidine kinase [Magnetococcales bacterium]
MNNRSSLKLRLVVSSALWITLALLATGGLIVFLFKGYVEQRFEDQLTDHLEELVAASEMDGSGTLNLTWEPFDPRFNRPHSGWYWQIFQNGEVIRQSRSILIKRLLPPQQGEAMEGMIQTTGPGQQPLLLFVRNIHLPNADFPHAFVVAGPVADILQDIYRFTTSMAIVLVALALILIGIMVLQVGFGLRPLRRISQSLSAIRTGREPHLPEDFPLEVQPLVSELNSMIDYNAALLQRARTQVGNLAHSLKNPLGILMNQAKKLQGEQGKSMQRHLQSASDNINRYLRRARIAGTGNVLGSHADLALIGKDLKYSMDVLFQEKNLEIRLEGLAGLRVHMDPEDLEEALGNVMDNACKWAKSQVLVKAESQPGKVIIWIIDDGPGIPQARFDHVLKRGSRLDENEPGDGLGLGIAEEIITLYGGTLILQEARENGLQVIVTLPLPVQ